MLNVEEKLAKSLTAESIELIPYLPYLLQDLWELGSSPKDIINMIQKNMQVSEKIKVLDLACGKGAVSVQVAKVLGCKVKGVDIIPEFVDFADKKAQEYSVDSLCDFKIGDINETVTVEKGYDIVILGAVGDVLGTIEETIQKLKGTVKNGGYIFIDDAYGNDDFDGRYPTKEKWLMFFQNAGVKLLDERFNEEDALERLNDEQQSFIVRRANELKEKYLEKTQLFESYIRSQQVECDELENEIIGVTMLLQVI
ncbi:methyltransferase domain-containing protein [Alkalibaculum sp. M08DMB]|uniref:Methyltransferase domain-containing protein n=1 Tax=Alkalibaculum sporogenes TaxID=2655001 RepID=A0A6A7K765_9FIRM|nr:class I SAM-dependent methyltransferase [Alkalibaculum sporogenes]MPW25264.1 methyltransferase domain-containing protein [Alkalibaculum sporogenes]